MALSCRDYAFRLKHIEGPVGVQARNFRNDKIRAIGWESKFSLEAGIARTYPWVAQQVKLARGK